MPYFIIIFICVLQPLGFRDGRLTANLAYLLFIGSPTTTLSRSILQYSQLFYKLKSVFVVDSTDRNEEVKDIVHWAQRNQRLEGS